MFCFFVSLFSSFPLNYYLIKWLYRGNTIIITDKPVVSIVAERLRISNGRRQTSWLLTEGGKGGYWSCFMENKMAISNSMGNKFGISRFKRFLYDQFFLLWLRTTSKGLRCSMSSPFSHFLFLVLWKGNWGLCLEVDARHHLLLKQTHCHQRISHRIQRAGLLQSNSWSYNFSQKIKNSMNENHSSQWIKHLILVCVGNSMICSDIWHIYHEWFFKIVIRNFMSR